MTRLVVVGGGISGLAAAWYAAAAGAQVTVLEAATEVGGKLRTAQVGGVPVDVGAEAMLIARPEGVALLDELAASGADVERIDPTTTSARIRAGGTAYPLPARTMMGIPGDVEPLRESGVVSAAALEMIGEEPSMPPLKPITRDVAVGALVRYRMGDEVADRLVEPLLGGVYAGRVDEMSLRATMPKLAERLAHGGSLLEAARAVTGIGTRAPAADGRRAPVFTSLRGGLGRLPQVLAGSGRFTVRTGVTVRAISRTPTGFALDCGAVPVAERIDCDAVVVAAPASKAARLVRDIAPAASADLGDVEAASTAIVTFAYDGSVPLPAGSGLLVAARERLAVKGVTLTSQKWSLGSPLTLLRASVGRARETQALQLDDADLTTMVRRELAVLLGWSADAPQPIDTRVTRWGGGLPQYTVGHLDRVGRIRAAVAGVPGLGVCGASFDGVGVPACIGAARAAADQALAGTPPVGGVA